MSLPMYVAPHLETALCPTTLRESISLLRKELRSVDFDCFVVCGLSGLLMGSVLGYKMKKPLLVVRKKDDTNSHSWKKIEGTLGVKGIFLDDLIATGDTFNHVLKTLKKEHPMWGCVGILLYYPDCNIGHNNRFIPFSDPWVQRWIK